jgi:hypothetical protein
MYAISSFLCVLHALSILRGLELHIFLLRKQMAIFSFSVKREVAVGATTA